MRLIILAIPFSYFIYNTENKTNQFCIALLFSICVLGDILTKKLDDMDRKIDRIYDHYFEKTNFDL